MSMDSVFIDPFIFFIIFVVVTDAVLVFDAMVILVLLVERNRSL